MRAVSALVVVGVVAGTGACGSDEPAESTVTPTPVVDLAQLDVGNYPTKPRDLGMAGTPEQARTVEAQRLANHIPLPSDIDPRFRYTYGNQIYPSVFIDPKPAVIGRVFGLDRFFEVAPDFVAGFSSEGVTELRNRGTDLTTVVLIFPDEQKATDAAQALGQINFDSGSPKVRVQIPSYPAAFAYRAPEEQNSLRSWLASGKFVILTYFLDWQKSFLKRWDPALLSLAEQVLDKVVPSVAKFSPTPLERLANAPIDLDSMLARTLPRSGEDTSLNPPGAYFGRSALHFTTDLPKERTAIEKAGVDRFATDGGNLYRARDASAAEQLRAELGGLSKKFKSSDSPRGLPAAKCKEAIAQKKLPHRFYCSVSYDRYAAFAWSNQLLDAQQRISAQYALLVNAR